MHLGPDGILNQRAVDAVLAHAAREQSAGRAVLLARAASARRLAQGGVMPGITRTANALEGGVPAWARGRRRWRRLCAPAAAAPRTSPTAAAPSGRRWRASPGRLLVVPHEFEQLVGWVSRRTPPGTEHTSFALRCSNRGAQFAWLDAGVHVPVFPGGFAALFARRIRANTPPWRAC